MINDIKKDMIEQLSYFKETNPKGYMPYDDVQEMVDGVLEKHNGIYPDYKDLLYKYDSITTELQVYKDKEDKLREYINRNAKENKELMEKYKEKINKLNKYDLTELLELSNQEAFHKAWYMCSDRALQILNEGE